MRKAQSHYARIIRGFREQTIGVLGDFMLDELLRGEATRISPEAPVPVVLLGERRAAQGFPGGAGNVAANIAALGGRPIPFGAIGKDESGQRLRALLKSRGIPANTLLQESNRVTPHKVRIAAHQHQLLRLDFEKPADISPRTAETLARSFARWVGRLDALIISDYRKGTVTTELCNQVKAIARQRRVAVFVDPKPEHPEICRHATAVTPNFHEAELMAGHPLRDRRELEAGGRRLLADLDCSYLLITRGAEGMTLFEAGGALHDIPSVPRPVYDVTGAGDTVVAVLALAYSSGASMLDAARLANLAAGRVVLKFGTAEISPQELLEAVPATSRIRSGHPEIDNSSAVSSSPPVATDHGPLKGFDMPHPRFSRGFLGICLFALLLGLDLSLGPISHTTAAPGEPPYGIVVSKNVMVTMRDGVRLATDIYRPAVNGLPASGKFPVILSGPPITRMASSTGRAISFHVGTSPWARMCAGGLARKEGGVRIATTRTTASIRRSGSASSPGATADRDCRHILSGGHAARPGPFEPALLEGHNPRGCHVGLRPLWHAAQRRL